MIQAGNKYRWEMAGPHSDQVNELTSSLGVSQLLAQCLVNRDHATRDHASRFLDPRLKNLADPFLLPGMSLAVERLVRARQEREPLVIFGDYDVDGVSATTLLSEVLPALGWEVRSYLPHRVTEGYGLNSTAVDRCLSLHPVRLLLAVDCGSTSVATIEHLKRRGIEVIVLDHHPPGAQAPPAVALVNPHCAPPHAPCFRELCAAGLAFKLAHALVKRGRDENWPGAADLDLRRWLDLVALATIADLVPLRGENRVLVNSGIGRLNVTDRPGLCALKKVAKSPAALGGYEVAFQLAPRLNAAGRLETAQDALQLLMCESISQAEPLAQRLDAQNRERQSIQRAVAEEAIRAAHARFDPMRDYVVVEGAEQWHVGVVGIVASRVAQEFYRPAVILGGCGEPAWRGSCRSIDGFDIGAALGQCGEWVLEAGGHRMAAGLKMLPEKLEGLREKLNSLARATLSPDQLRPTLSLDAEVTLAQLTVPGLRELERLNITGIGNPAVQVCVRGLSLVSAPRRLGADKQHVKLQVTDGTACIDVVWWGAGDANIPSESFDLAGAPQLNEYRGNVMPQIKLLDYILTGQRVGPAQHSAA